MDGFCFFCLHNRRRSGPKKLHWGPILSGIGLSGSDRDERVSNLLDISKEAVVSNNEVEKFGIPQRMHSHATYTFAKRLIVDSIHS